MHFFERYSLAWRLGDTCLAVRSLAGVRGYLSYEMPLSLLLRRIEDTKRNIAKFEYSCAPSVLLCIL